MPKRPTRVGRFKPWFLEHVLTGVYTYPSIDEVKSPIPRSGESDAEARRRVLDHFADAAADTDRRASAALTGAGFAIAVNGILLNSGPVSQRWLFVLALPPVIAFIAGLSSFLVWVERGAGAENEATNLEDARAACIHKQFWAVLASVMAIFAVIGYVYALGYIAFS
jgi:hypothetical protein